jgi:hypothetical protein
VGTLLVVLIVAAAMFVLVGGAVAWVVLAWIRQMWREVRRTPTFGRVSRGVGMARPVLAYRDVLRRAPAQATEMVVRIQRKAQALDAIRDQLGSEPRYRIAETTTRYLPDTLQAYRIAVVGQGREQRQEASRLLIDQLGAIDRNLDRIAAGAGETGIAALRANGVFLDEISERPPLAPGRPQDGDDGGDGRDLPGSGQHTPA